MRTSTSLSPRAWQRLRSRHLVLWAGPSLPPNEHVLRLPWEAVFVNGATDEVERVFRTVHSESAVVRSTPDENEGPISRTQFRYLFNTQGGPGRALTGRKQIAWRCDMVKALGTWETDSLLVVAGYDDHDDLLVEHLDEVVDTCPTLSVVVLDAGPDRRALLQVAAASAKYPALGNAFDLTLLSDDLDSWLAGLERDGISIGQPEAPARLLLGQDGEQATIDLVPLLRGERRLDEVFRLITTSSLIRPAEATLDEAMFRACMVRDETADAETSETDLLEWQGFAGELYYPRWYPAVAAKPIEEFLVDRLHRVATDDLNKPSILWFDCEPFSGATTFLHGLAFKIAQRGYPTLVLKQDARSLDVDVVADFLHGLHLAHVKKLGDRHHVAETHAPAEVPALIVLDVQHDRTQGAIELGIHLARSKRRAVILWAVDLDGELIESHETLGPLARRSEGSVLPRFTRQTQPGEARDVLKHFDRFNHPPYALHLHTTTPNEFAFSEVDESARAIFWVQLYYALRYGDGRSVLSKYFRDKLRPSLLGQGESPRRMWYAAALLQLAKLSQQRLHIPERVLRAWLVRVLPLSAASEDADGTSLATLQECEATLETLAAQDAFAVRFRDTDWDTHVRLAHPVYGRLALEAFGGLAQDNPELKDVATKLEIDVANPIAASPSWYRSLLASLVNTPTHVRFAEQLSEEVLIPPDDDEAWKTPAAEDYYTTWQCMATELRRTSRVLAHREAVLLRRSTRWPGMSDVDRDKRLVSAWECTRIAMSIEGRTNARDEHPAHIETTAGFIAATLARRQPTKWPARAEEAFQDALRRLPENLYARQGCADLYVWWADHLLVDAGDTARVEACRLFAQAVRLLALEPNRGHEVRWYKTRQKALDRVKQGDGAKLIDELVEARVDAGFVLKAELALDRVKPGVPLAEARIREALRILRLAVDMPNAREFPESMRFALELMERLPDEARDYTRRFRLLKALEDVASRLSADEEFLLAVMAYQTGQYPEGRRRFQRLRDTRRSYEVSASNERYWLMDRRDPMRTEPRELTGRVQSVESDQYGYVWCHDLNEAVTFRPSHFRLKGQRVRGHDLKCYVRFSGSGPKAVPIRFFTGK